MATISAQVGVPSIVRYPADLCPPIGASEAVVLFDVRRELIADSVALGFEVEADVNWMIGFSGRRMTLRFLRRRRGRGWVAAEWIATTTTETSFSTARRWFAPNR